MELLIWFAQAPGAKPGAASLLVQFLPFIIIFVLFWFLIIRPQRKREQEHREMLNVLKKGDKVVMNSGIFGEISSVSTTTAVLEIAPKVKVTVQRSSIAGVIDAGQFDTLQQQNPAPIDETERSSKMLKKKKK